MSSSIKKTKNIPKPTNFGSNLKFLRRLKGIGQSDLAISLDLTRNKIATYEAGIVEPNAKTFLAICMYFGMSPRKMLESKIDEHPSETVLINNSLDEPIDKIIINEIEEFIFQTNEMTKIVEGYKSLLEIKKESNDYKKLRALNYLFEDLLNLFEKLIQSNWNVITSILPKRNNDRIN